MDKMKNILPLADASMDMFYLMSSYIQNDDTFAEYLINNNDLNKYLYQYSLIGWITTSITKIKELLISGNNQKSVVKKVEQDIDNTLLKYINGDVKNVKQKKDMVRLLTLVRGKLAHGDFKIDVDNNCLEIDNITNYEDLINRLHIETPIKMPIDGLQMLIMNCLYISIPDFKDNSYIIEVLRSPLVPIRKKQDIIKLIRSSFVEITSLTRKDNEPITIEDYENYYNYKQCGAVNYKYLENLLQYRYKDQYVFDVFKDYFIEDKSKNEISINIHNQDKIIRQGDIDQIYSQVQVLDKNKYSRRYNQKGVINDYPSYQDQICNRELLLLLRPERYQTIYELEGIRYTQVFINGIKNHNISGAVENSRLTAPIDAYSLFFPLMSAYNALFSYPLDDTLIDNFPFEKLNLSGIKITSEKQKEIIQKVNSIDNDIIKLDYIIDKANLNISSLNNNPKKESIIAKLKEKIEDVKAKKRDLEKQKTYYLSHNRNLNIIKGIRNSIAHGNYKITNGNTIHCGDSLILFRDEFNENEPFECIFTLEEFHNFIINNKTVINEFIKSSQKQSGNKSLTKSLK